MHKLCYIQLCVVAESEQVKINKKSKGPMLNGRNELLQTTVKKNIHVLTISKIYPTPILVLLHQFLSC